MKTFLFALVEAILWILGCPRAETTPVGAGFRIPTRTVPPNSVNQAATWRQPTGNEETTKVHPSVATVGDNHGLLATISDNDDTGTGTESAAPRKRKRSPLLGAAGSPTALLVGIDSHCGAKPSKR